MEIVRKERQARGARVVLELKCGHQVTLQESYRGWNIACQDCESIEIRKRKAQEKVYRARKQRQRLVPAY